MSRLLAILRSVPPRELAEDLIGAALLLVLLLNLPEIMAIAAVLAEAP